MSKSDVFHLGLTKNDLQGATLAIVPGDPERVEKIAALMDKPVKLASHREFTTWRAELDGKAVKLGYLTLKLILCNLLGFHQSEANQYAYALHVHSRTL
jgi:hypothetical protein